MLQSKVRSSLGSVVNQHLIILLGVVTACYDLGAVVGSLTCIGYSDKIGRLRTIFCGLVLSVIALAIESSSYTLAQFVVGRLLVGGAIGIISAAVPVWQTECSRTKHRGAFVIFEGLCISGGITISEWVSFGLFFAPEGSVQWRVPLVLCVIFSLFVMPVIFLMPESPRWLARQGRMDEARQVLAVLADEDPHSTTISAEMTAIQESLGHTRGSLKLLLKNGEQRYGHRLALAMCGQFFQQMCGISALVFYTSTIFSDLGFDTTKARILSACLTTFQTCCSTIPLFTVDRFGRRKLFMFSAAGLSMTMAIFAGTSGHKSLATVSVVFIFLYDFFYPIGFLGLTFLYATEVAPLRMRVPITAIANATQWLCQFVVGQITPPGTTNLANKYWIIFAVLNASFIPVVYFFFPETNGRSLEEMDGIFANSNVFDLVANARKMPRHNSFSVDDAEASSQEGRAGAGVLAQGRPLQQGEKGWLQEVERSSPSDSSRSSER